MLFAIKWPLSPVTIIYTIALIFLEKKNPNSTCKVKTNKLCHINKYVKPKPVDQKGQISDYFMILYLIISEFLGTQLIDLVWAFPISPEWLIINLSECNYSLVNSNFFPTFSQLALETNMLTVMYDSWHRMKTLGLWIDKDKVKLFHYLLMNLWTALLSEVQ